MRAPSAKARSRLAAAVATAGALALAAAVAAGGSCSGSGRGEPGTGAPPAATAAAASPGERPPGGGRTGLDPAEAGGVERSFPDPSAGWEEAAESVATDLGRVLGGSLHPGAYAEARAEASRRDLALFPPPRERVRRLLLGSARDRTLALAALAARPDLDDDLLRLVLRSQRPGDDEVVRLLGAEIAAGVPAELAARHEEELLRAFEAEPNPLVLAVALPALERLDEARLRSLLRAQAVAAPPEMLPILLALARDRLGAAALEDAGAALAAPIPAGGR